MTESSPTVPMIEAQGLSKFYGDFAACRDITFSMDKGEIVAFLGPNGAGKSTTMKLLTGYLAAVGRRRPDRRTRHGDRSAGRVGSAGIPAGKRTFVSRYDAGQPAGVLRRGPGVGLPAHPRPDRRGRRHLRLGERLSQADQQAVEGISSARGHGPGAAARAGRADHGRAHGRAGSESDSGSAAHDAATGGGTDDSAFHAYPAGSRGDGQPGDHCQRRTTGGRCTRWRISRGNGKNLDKSSSD